MQPQGWGQFGRGGGGAQRQGGQDQQPWIAGTTKVPPYWDPSMDIDGAGGYSFTEWAQDVVLWSIACELDEQQKGAAVVLRLGGEARRLCRELDHDSIMNGGQADLEDGQGMRQVNGHALILRGLSKKFAPLPIETHLKVIDEMQNVHRLRGESVDKYLARFETLRFRATQRGNFDLGPTGTAWQLLSGLGIGPQGWVTLLQPLQGRMPATVAELQGLIDYIRRQGHLLDQGLPGMRAHGRFQGFAQDQAFPAWQQPAAAQPPPPPADAWGGAAWGGAYPAVAAALPPTCPTCGA